jgi:simple sugar transport system ATP-binding protein
MLVDTMTVAENIILGAETGTALQLDLEQAEKDISKLSEELKLGIDPRAFVENLSVGQQQRVELLKALFRDAELLILDEPTAVLTPQEVDDFFGILRSMKRQGKTIVIITHKLEEVLAISDNVTVMRDGKSVGDLQTEGTTKEQLAKLIVGREVLLRVEKSEANPGGSVLKIHDLHVSGKHGDALKGVGFEVKAGEIVGIAGVEGNGQTELIEAIAGLVSRKNQHGSIQFQDVEISATSARTRKELGIGHIPEDRQKRGLLLNSDLAENSILGVHYRPPATTSFGILDSAGIRGRVDEIIRDFDVRPPNPNLTAGSLSGGNQQKLIIGREFELNPKLLLVSQPTRGVDIGAIEFIHRKLIELRDAGTAVLLVSAELEEVMALSDRLLVFREGEIVGEVDPTVTSVEEIGLMMTGGGMDNG